MLVSWTTVPFQFREKYYGLGQEKTWSKAVGHGALIMELRIQYNWHVSCSHTLSELWHMPICKYFLRDLFSEFIVGHTHLLLYSFSDKSECEYEFQMNSQIYEGSKWEIIIIIIIVGHLLREERFADVPWNVNVKCINIGLSRWNAFWLRNQRTRLSVRQKSPLGKSVYLGEGKYRSY